MNYKKINPKDSDVKTIYHLMIAGIAPRPIALVGSIDLDSNINLAPFSFFNAFGANPPIVGFSPALSGRTGLPKDTLLNIQQTKEFTISIVTSDIVNQVSLASCEFPKDVDEFVKSGLNKFNSNLIKPPGVKESPFIMECKLYKIIELGNKPASGNLILGEIVMFHVSDTILSREGSIDPTQIDHVARNGGPWYSSIKETLFELNKPKGIGIGFDSLPYELINSELKGSELAKLASISKIPVIDDEISDLVNIDFNCLINEISKFLSNDKIYEAWNLFLNWKNKNE